jgi:putative alpha-1,2-mannosidase
MLTQGKALWFAATYGSPENRSGGSNVPTWSTFGMVKLSPDNTEQAGLDAGYEHTIESISGFGHVHGLFRMTCRALSICSADRNSTGVWRRDSRKRGRSS